jgi:hypothetical protein
MLPLTIELGTTVARPVCGSAGVDIEERQRLTPGRSVDDRPDLLESHPKHIVEHQRQAFRRLQLLEDDE